MNIRMGVVLALLALVATAVALVAVRDDGRDADPAGVVDRVRQRLGLDLEGSVTGSGYLEGRTVNVTAELPGRVWSVPVRTGDAVEAGAVLVEMEDAAITALQDQSVSSLQAAHARLAEVTSGAPAQQIERLTAARDQALQAERAAADALAAARAAADALAAARAAAAPPAGLDALAGAQQLARAQLDVAQARLAVASAGASPYVIRAARAGVRAAEAALGATELQADRLTLRAPITGTVTLVSARPGQTVAQGAVVARVSRSAALQLVVYVGEADLDRVQVGQPVEVTVDGLDASHDGEVVALAAQAEFTPRNVQTAKDRQLLCYAVTIRVPNESGRLRAGMAADARIDVR